MFTPAPATHGFSEFIAGKMTASADDRVLWQHVEQARLIECPDQDEAYFDMIMGTSKNWLPLRAMRISLLRT